MPIEVDSLSDHEDDFSGNQKDEEPKSIIMDPFHRQVEEGQLYWQRYNL